MIEAIFTAPAEEASQSSHQSVNVVAGAGIEGDRYFDKDTESGEEVTFIEAEAIERFNRDCGQNIEYYATRRNVITRGVDLNRLIGKEFTCGAVRFRGVEHCDPCASLGESLENDTLTRAEVVKAFVVSGGLRADILNDGELAVGMKFSFE